MSLFKLIQIMSNPQFFHVFPGKIQSFIIRSIILLRLIIIFWTILGHNQSEIQLELLVGSNLVSWSSPLEIAGEDENWG